MPKLKNPLLRGLAQLRGNPRACVYTEPMWGLSMNLCLPYASVYMLALGLNDAEVGFIATLYMMVQVLCAYLSGAIIDKIGRRWATAVFDFLAWSIPCLIWAFAQGFWFFFVAALFNGTMKVTTNSWDCLLVEDAEPDQITKVYSWVIMAGHLSAFFAPISAIMVSNLTLVPAIRILYINAFVVMTAKIFILFRLSRETRTGARRMQEVKGQSFRSLLGGYGSVAKMMLRSIIALVFFLTVIARISQLNLRQPLLAGFASYFVGQGLLLLTPTGGGTLGYVVLCLSLVFDGFAMAMLAMLAESLVAIHVDAAERARVMGLLQMTVMLVSAPFGWIAGLLSNASRVLPFVMNLLLIVLGIVTTAAYYRRGNGRSVGKEMPAGGSE